MVREDITGLQGHSQTWQNSPSPVVGLAEQTQLGTVLVVLNSSLGV